MIKLFVSGLGDVDRLSVTNNNMPATGQKISLYHLLRQLENQWKFQKNRFWELLRIVSERQKSIMTSK